MEEAIEKFLEKLNEEFLNEVYEFFGIDPDELDEDVFDIILSRRSEIVDRFFPYIKPFLNDPNFYAAFDLTNDDVMQKVVFTKMLISDEVYYRFIEEAVRQRESKELPLIVMSSGDIEALLNQGFSLSEISKFELFSDEVAYDLYKRDRSLYERLLSGYSTNLGAIVANEYVLGNKDALSVYLEKYNFDQKFIGVLRSLSEYQINIKQFISDVNVSVKFDNEVTYSVVEDESLLQQLINSWGPEAVVFGKTISRESAQLANNFSYDDYIFYDGSIKNSPYILLNLLNKGYTEALFNCGYKAINEEIIDFIKEHNIPYSDIAKSDILLKSYLINKMLTDSGYTGIISDTADCLSDVNAFNYVYNYFLNKYTEDEHVYYSYSDDTQFIKAFALNQELNSFTYYLSNEVAKRVVELGLDFETYLNKFINVRGLCEVFYENGDKRALFASEDYNYITDHINEVTYEDFLSYVSLRGSNISLHHLFVEKFFKEGHVDIVNYLSDEVFNYLEPRQLGIDDIPYEEYLKLPEKIQNLPFFKRKFTKRTPEELLTLLETDNSDEVVYEALQAGVDPHKILSMSYYFSLRYKTVMLFLEKGCTDAITFYSKTYGQNDDERALVALFYEKSGGLLPDFSHHCDCEEEFIRYYVSKGRFDILDGVYSFKYFKIDSILGDNYTLDVFREHPVLDGRIIKKLITPENASEVFDIIFSHNSKIFSFLEDFMIYILQSDFDDNYIYQLSQTFTFDIDVLIRKSPIEIKELLSLINRSSLYEDKRYLDIILKNLTPTQIKGDLATFYVSDNMNMYIIHKMIEAGHYDFVTMYRNRVVTESLKEAILHGVFPASLKLSRDEYSKVLNSLVFTDEEIEILRSMVDTQPQYALLIPDIKNNIELLIDYLKNAPEYIKLIDKKYYSNPRLLVSLVTVDPNMVAYYVNGDTPAETIAMLIRVNHEFLDSIPSYLVSEEVVDLVSASFPEIIDRVSHVSDVAIKNAFDNGYVISNKTKDPVIMYALHNGIPVPIEVLAKNMGPLFSAMWSASVYKLLTPEQFYKTFKPYIEALYNLDENEFYYQAALKSYSFDDAPLEYRILLDEYKLVGLDKIYGYIDDREQFNFALYINRNNITAENIDLLEPYFEKVTNIYKTIRQIEDMFKTYTLDSDHPVKKFLARMATKHFASDPLNLISYVNINDPEIINTCKGMLDEHPDLYRQVPGVLSDKETILKLIALGENVYPYLSDAFKDDLDILEKSLLMNYDNIRYINKENVKVMNFLLSDLEKFPMAFMAYPHVLVSNGIYPGILSAKDLILKLMPLYNGAVYDYITEEAKRDFDICLAYAQTNRYALMCIPTDVPDFGKIVDAAVRKFPELFAYDFVRPFITQELYEFVVLKVKDAFAYLPIELQTLDNFRMVPDKATFDYSLLPGSVLIEVAASGELEFDADEVFTNRILSLLLGNASLFSQNINPKLIEILKKGVPYLSTDSQLFKQYSSLGNDFDYYLLGDEVGLIFKYARDILNSTGKVNTIEKNPVFSYDLCKYIYPAFGVNITLDFIKFNTPAAEKVIQELKNGNKDLLLNYYNLLIDKNILENDDKLVHFAYRSFDTFKNLIMDVLNHKDELSIEDCTNLSKIIRNSNYYQINTFSQLKKYTEITRAKTEDILNADNINQIKSFISQLFGFSFDSLKNVYTQYQLGNFSKIAYVKQQIIEKMGKEEFNKVKHDLLYNREELKLLLLIKQVIYSDNIEEIKEIMKIHISDAAKDIDYSLDFQKIIEKIRKLYTLQFNLYLSRPEDIKSPRIDRNDPDNKYGVTIIDMSSEEFKFLAHRLYGYDSSHSGYAEMIKNDPSLWFKLEGASTLSTCCFSDKGFWYLHSEDPTGVVYLFDSMPPDAILFMYGRDLMVQHGGYRLEPTANYNAFSDVDGLVQSSNYHHCPYNEVAVFREGMVPCAILCTADEPSPDQIRAAKFFSEHTGKDIPIIKFNIPAYNAKKEEEYNKNKELYKDTLDIDLIEKIILSGVDANTSNLVENATYCFNIAKDAYQNGRISYIEFFKYMSRIIRTLNRLENTLPAVQKEITRITLYRQSLIALCSMDRDTIRRLNNADMGESGLMYRLEEDEKSYLVKPAVEKGTFRRQDFRAEIQSAASKLQKILSPDTTVEVDVIRSPGVSLSKQDLVKINKEKTKDFEEWVNNGGELDENIKNGLLREYVIDFLLCNFDCFYGNFVIDEAGNVRGIDKEQSFRFMSDSRSLNPDFSYIPNGAARVPIYKILFERYRKGEISLDFSVVTDTIEKARSIPEEKYREMFREYAVSLDKYKAEEILNMITSRREVALERIEEFINELSMGVKM